MQILLQILRGLWLIDFQTAINLSPLVTKILDRGFAGTVKAETGPFVSFVKDGQKGKTADEMPIGCTAIVDIMGVMMKKDGWCGEPGTDTIRREIENLANNPRVKSILLNIDSPGGTVDGTLELANTVSKYKSKIIAFTNGMVASAAYWVASSAREIVANSQLNQLGSIGVMVSWQDMKPYYEAQGVKFHNVNSDLSPDKNKLFKDAEEGDYSALKEELLNPIAQVFIGSVKDNRKNIQESQLTGKTYLAKDVVGSMVDRIGTMQDAIDRINKLNSKQSTIYV